MATARRVSVRVLSSALTIAVLTPMVACDKPADTTPPTSAPGTTETASNDDILASSDLPPLVPEPLANDDMGVTIHRLSNGLTVYISTERQKPRISTWIAVRTGSRNDPAASTGLAHYLEHMLFKGTGALGTLDYEAERPHLDRIADLYDQLRGTEDEAKRAEIFAEIDAETQKSAQYAVPNEFDRLYSSMGISGVNAFTNDDATVYISDIPVNRLEAWARVEAERFADPAFRLFYPELEAVYEEKNRALDSAFRRVNEAMLAALFPGHPYGTQDTLGKVDHLKVPAYGDMVDYFHRWYVPNNMAVVLAGDIDAETALPVLERTLGQWSPAALTPPEGASDAGPKGRNLVEVTAEGENTVTLAWRTRAASHVDTPALEVMDWVMDNGQAGLLDVELELPQKVPNASSSHTTQVEAGYWELSATAKEGQTHEEVEKLLLDVVAKLKDGAFDQADVDAVILETIKSDKQSLEFARARVWKMTEAFINRMAWPDWVAANEAKRQVSKEDIVRVAKTYLGDDFVVVYRKNGKPSLPKIDAPKITPVPIDNTRQSPFAKDVLEIPAAPLEPEWLEAGKQYAVSELPAGRLISAKNENNDLFSITYAFDRGTRQDQLLCLAFDALEASGTESLAADALQKKVYSLGSSIGFGCSDDGSSIRISGFDDKMEETLALLQSWMKDAKVDPDQIERLVTNEISRRRDAMANPRFLAYALGEFAFYGKESSLLADASNKKLLAAKPKQLKSILERAPNFTHTTMYFGPRSADDAAKVIGLGEKHTKVADPSPRRYRKAKGDQAYFMSGEVAKSSISLAMPLGVQDDAKRPAAELMGEYYGGAMSSAIFQEIREARGLAYAARGWMSDGNRKGDDWAFAGFMETQSDKTLEALKVYIGLVRTRTMEASRIAEAKRSLEESYRSSRVEPRFVTAWVESWFERGDGTDPRPVIREGVKKLDDAAVQSFADQIDDGPLILSIYGNEAKIDMKALAALTPKTKITKVKPEQLTSWGAFPKAKKQAGGPVGASGKAAGTP